MLIPDGVELTRTPVNSALVNWLPWSVLKISGFAVPGDGFLERRRTKSAVSVLDSRHASTRRVAQSDADQVQEPFIGR